MIRLPRQSGDPFLVSPQRIAAALSLCGPPHADNVVLAARGELLAIGRPCHREHPILMALECMFWRLRVDVPDAHSGITGCTGQRAPIGGELDAEHRLTVAGKRRRASCHRANLEECLWVIYDAERRVLRRDGLSLQQVVCVLQQRVSHCACDLGLAIQVEGEGHIDAKCILLAAVQKQLVQQLIQLGLGELCVDFAYRTRHCALVIPVHKLDKIPLLLVEDALSLLHFCKLSLLPKRGHFNFNINFSVLLLGVAENSNILGSAFQRILNF